MAFPVILIDHLERKFPHYQFEYAVAGMTGGRDSRPRDTIKFYQTCDHHGRIEIIEDLVQLWAQEEFLESAYRVVRVHRFSLCEPDSILWIERFVAAGKDRFEADLTRPLPAATGGCDSDWKTVGDERFTEPAPLATVGCGERHPHSC